MKHMCNQHSWPLFQVWSSALQPVPFSLPLVLWGLPWPSTVADHQQHHLMKLHPQWVWPHRCWGMRQHRHRHSLTPFHIRREYVDSPKLLETKFVKMMWCKLVCISNFRAHLQNIDANPGSLKHTSWETLITVPAPQNLMLHGQRTMILWWKRRWVLVKNNILRSGPVKQRMRSSQVIHWLWLAWQVEDTHWYHGTVAPLIAIMPACLIILTGVCLIVELIVSSIVESFKLSFLSFLIITATIQKSFSAQNTWKPVQQFAFAMASESHHWSMASSNTSQISQCPT